MLWSVRKRKTLVLPLHRRCMLFKNGNFFFFFLFYFGHQTLHGTVLQNDNARPHAECNTTRLLANDNIQKSPSAFRVPRLKPKQTHLEWVGETRSRQGECPCKCAWFVSRHSGRSGWLYPAQVIYDLIQSLSQVMLSRYWFSERTHPYWCACPLVTKYQGTELFLGGEER